METFCSRCKDTGIVNHAEIAAYWDAIYEAFESRRRSFGKPQPHEEACNECPRCAICFVEAREHKPHQAAQCAAEYREHGADILPVSFESERELWWLPGEAK